MSCAAFWSVKSVTGSNAALAGRGCVRYERERERERINHEWGGGGGSAGECLGSGLPAAMRILKRRASRIDVRNYMYEFLLKIMNPCGHGHMVYTWCTHGLHMGQADRTQVPLQPLDSGWTAGLSPSLSLSLVQSNASPSPCP
jgi:hypothetical protein